LKAYAVVNVSQRWKWFEFAFAGHGILLRRMSFQCSVFSFQ
jgi:hypothetical protein